MFCILYNDNFSNLFLASNLDTEVVMIIDDDLNKHYEKSYSLDHVEDENLLNARKKAIDNFYELDTGVEGKNRTWRENMASKSVNAFKAYLTQSKTHRLPDYEKTVKDFIRHLIYNTCDCLDRLDFYDEESNEVDQIVEYVYKWYLTDHTLALSQLVETVLYFELEEGMMILNASAYKHDMNDYLRDNF